MISNESYDKALAEVKLGLSLVAQVSFGISEIQRILGWGYNRSCYLVEYGVETGKIINCLKQSHLYMFKPDNNFSCSTHVQMKVETALNMSDREIKSWWGDDVKAVRAELNRLKESGRIYLHTKGCNNEDPATGECLGHYENKGGV